jgi:hypothetical protein
MDWENRQKRRRGKGMGVRGGFGKAHGGVLIIF